MTHAVIGTGHWGSNHARVSAELVESGVLDELVLCDVDNDRTADLASSYGVEYVTDYEELFGWADTAVVATPSPTHHPIATDLLERNVDCLVEKPLALSSDNAWEIVATSREYDRTLGVGHIFRYHPALMELNRRIDRGEFGTIKYLKSDRYSFREPRETTGVLYQLAVHDIDIYQLLLNETPESIYCQLDYHLRENIDETASLVLEYETATGVINESWQVPAFGKKRDLIAVGTERAVYIDYLADTELEIFDSKVVREGNTLRMRNEGGTTYDVEGGEPLKMEVEDFLAAARGDRKPRASGEIGAKTIEILEYAKQSNELGEAVGINLHTQSGS